MKYIDRNGVSIPAVLATTNSRAAIERAKVREHYRDPNCVTYTFRAYKDADVLNALNSLFNNKCAYCESDYLATSPTDIEHFRPKGRISDEASHKGYWWLASTWNNLLPSCIACNREKFNELILVEPTGLRVENSKSGKYDKFPLKGGYRAFNESDDLTREDPLLIDPTIRDPAQYLTWREIEASQVIVPLHTDDAATTPYAKASIDIYGLNRRPLVEARTGIARSIKVDAQLLAASMTYASELDASALAKYMPQLENSLRVFVEKKNNHPKFAAMIEFLVDRELENMSDQLKTLRDRL